MLRLIQKLTLANVFFISMFFSPNDSFSQYKFEKIEEFKINSLYPVEIVDYYPQDKLYLGYLNTSKGTRITLINESGEMIIQKVLKGDGPNLISSALNSLSFSQDGDIWIQTPIEIVLFDQKLNIKKRIRYLSSSKMQIYGRMEVFHYFNQNESLSSFSFITNPSGTNSYMPNRENLIEIYRVEKEELHTMAPVTDRPLYKKFDKSMLGNLYFLVYTLDPKKRKLYVTTRLDNEITVYDLNTRKLESRIKIAHDEFKILNKTSITNSDFPSYGNISLGSINHKIFLLDGGMVVLDYIKEIPYGTYEKKIADDPTYHHFQDPAYHRLILFDGTKQLSGDLPLPINGKLTMTLPNNRLLVQLINPDVEEDFIRYGIYKLIDIKK